MERNGQVRERNPKEYIPTLIKLHSMNLTVLAETRISLTDSVTEKQAHQMLVKKGSLANFLNFDVLLSFLFCFRSALSNKSFKRNWSFLKSVFSLVLSLTLSPSLAVSGERLGEGLS